MQTKVKRDKKAKVVKDAGKADALADGDGADAEAKPLSNKDSELLTKLVANADKLLTSLNSLAEQLKHSDAMPWKDFLPRYVMPSHMAFVVKLEGSVASVKLIIENKLCSDLAKQKKNVQAVMTEGKEVKRRTSMQINEAIKMAADVGA